MLLFIYLIYYNLEFIPDNDWLDFYFKGYSFGVL